MECQGCGRQVQTAFICGDCCSELADLMSGLSIGWRVENDHRAYRSEGWGEFLEDARFGQTRLGESTRRSSELSRPALARLTDDEKDSFKGSPRELQQKAHGTAARWVQETCEIRGITFMPVNSVGHRFIGPLPPGVFRLPEGYSATFQEMVSWLIRHVSSVALNESAGQCLNEFRGLVSEIERCINRPRPKRYCGNCPTLDEDEQRCATPLYAESHDDNQVECWRCHKTFVIDDLIQGSLDNARGWLFSEREVLDIMAQIGRHIPRGTWWSWKDRGVIVNKNEWGAEPRFLLEDVQDAWQERIGNRKTA
jgi:hypothetical protein